MGSDEGLDLTGPLFCLFSLMSDEIEWSQIIDGIDLIIYCAVGRSSLGGKKRGKKRKKKKDLMMIAFWSLGIIHIYLLVRCRMCMYFQ